MPAIISAVARTGAVAAGYVPLRLAVDLNDPNLTTRMQGSAPYAAHISELFEISCRKANLNSSRPQLSAGAFRRTAPAQMSLF